MKTPPATPEQNNEWVTVPREPTEAMVDAGQRYINSVAYQGQHLLPVQFRWTEFWSAMLDASPAPPSDAPYTFFQFGSSTALGDSRLAPAQPVGDDALREAIIKKRARKICTAFGRDPDEIVDPYGPVQQLDVVAYHIYEAIEEICAPANPDAVEGMREALKPVMHWYQSDEQDERPLPDIVADVVADLESDRATVLQVIPIVAKVLAYDEMLRRYDGPLSTLCSGDVTTIDAAYDSLVAAARAALDQAPSRTGEGK